MTGPETPPHATIILPDAVHVAGMTGPIRSGLLDAGRTVRNSPYGSLVRYRPGPSDLDNTNLVELLQLLAGLGVGFARDFKQVWSPAEVVAELIDRGVDFHNPWACGFDGQVWHVQPYPWTST